MSFSYSSSLDAWTPARSKDAAKIRILELHPPARYLKWLPRFLMFLVPLRANLAWAPLRQNAAPTKTGPKSPDKSEMYPPYKALSYTWGDNQMTHDIYVNGKKLTITLSLAFALYHLRPKTKPLRIWIDQICINQEDKQEKTEQVGFMDRIYRNTEEALVWLGPAADGSDALIDMFNKLGVFAEQFNLLAYYKKDKYHELQDIELKVNPQDPKSINYHAFCDSIVHEFTHTFFASLIAFYGRPWFYRAWVVQEFSLPPKVTFICGHKTIQAETLMVVLRMITSTMTAKVIRATSGDQTMMSLLETHNGMNTLDPFFSSRQRRKVWDEGRDNGDSLYQVLQRVCVEQLVQATHGCDMVYGLLGLVNDAKDLGISANYSEEDQQLQAALTYTRTARAIISSGKVDLLIFAQHKKQDMTLPSWVPDWRSEIRRSFAWLQDEEKGPLFRACAGQPLELCRDDDERVLALKGYKVDKVEEVGGPWTGGSRGDRTHSRFPFEEYINYLAQIRQMCLLSKAKNPDIYTSPDRRDEAIWRIPVGDVDQDDTFLPCRATQSCKHSYDHCVAQLELQLQANSMASLEEYKTRAAEVNAMGETRVAETDARGNVGSLYRIRMHELKGKRPFLSHIGYVGMGPSYMRPGDVIVVLSGASVPFIARPIGEGRFRFLGECYCDGIMDGEIVDRRVKETIVFV